MKRMLRIWSLVCLAIAALTVSALADSGPKPQLVVRVENAPEEAYYLDLLAEGAYKGHTYGIGASAYSGLDWSYSEEELAALDQPLLDALRTAVPEGWHACTAEGTDGAPMWGQLYAESADAAGNPLHTFGYVGVPDTYRILMVTQSGEVFCSDACTRPALQSSATVDWAAKTVTIPPAWVGYALQFLSTLLPTLAVECLLLPLFGFAWRRNWKPFLLVNLVTQGALSLYFSVHAVQAGVSFWYFLLLLPAEILIALTEGGLYARLLTGRSRLRAFAYGVTANTASALLGLMLMEPVWRFVVSIS
jgi:hypothetical protein